MDVSQLNRSRVNESRVNCSVLNASGFDGACRRSRVPGIGADIMKSMVLWYDIAKQGATNESMAENPVLRDLSGNGHDATCYNFAWSGMSGVGGYSQNYNKKWYIDDTRVSATVTNIQINVTSVLRTLIGVYYQSNSDEVAFTVPSYKVRVSGLTDGQAITYRDGTSTVSYTIDRDGEYTLPQIDFSAQGGYYGFILNKVQESCNITIEQLPIYPHALVSDGVDDYCLAEGLPTLNDYTFFVDTSLSLNKLSSFYSRIVGKYSSNNKYDFLLFGTNRDTRPTNYGFITFNEDPVPYANFITPISGINVATKDTFNGIDLDIVGKDYGDCDKLIFFAKKGNDNLSDLGAYALKTFILFNRTLTPEEIEWVKTNLIETEQ